MYRTACRFGRFPSLFILAFVSVVAAALCSFAEPASAASTEREAALPGTACTVAAMPVHANGEHPAVRVARMARRVEGRGIDANTFIVQPPASVRWTLAPEADPSVQLAAVASAAAAGTGY